MTNPLLTDWDTPFQIAPFDRISDDDFAPAFEQALTQDMTDALAVAQNPDAPSFANTIEALMSTGQLLDKVLSTFYTIAGADSNAAREALMRDFSPKLSAHSSEIYSNKALFAGIDALWTAQDTLDLDDEQARVLMLTHRNFIRAGAGLTGAAEVRMKEIKERLAVLGTEFSQNLLADEREWQMELSDSDMEGLPEFLKAAAKAAGSEKGVEGAIITLSRSLVVPFMQFSPRRDLRETAYKAWAARGANGGATDNRELAREMLALRQEMANLLGYPDFASFKLGHFFFNPNPNPPSKLKEAASTSEGDSILFISSLVGSLRNVMQSWNTHLLSFMILKSLSSTFLENVKLYAPFPHLSRSDS